MASVLVLLIRIALKAKRSASGTGRQPRLPVTEKSSKCSGCGSERAETLHILATQLDELHRHVERRLAAENRSLSTKIKRLSSSKKIAPYCEEQEDLSTLQATFLEADSSGDLPRNYAAVRLCSRCKSDLRRRAPGLFGCAEDTGQKRSRHIEERNIPLAWTVAVNP